MRDGMMGPVGRRTFLKSVGATTVTFTPLKEAMAERLPTPVPRRPNVLVILVDDLGFADLGCYGGEIRTPNIDRLSEGGVRYVNFRTAAVCAATRASLLTGLNPHSAGIGLLTDEDRGFPGYRGDLTQEAATTAEVLRATGYSTLHVGKWHVNHVSSSSAHGPRHNWPLQRGFGRAFWFQGHSSDYFDPSDMFEGNDFLEVRGGHDYYITDDLGDKAIRYLEDHHRARPEDPWYLYLAFNAPHSPLQVRVEDRESYRGQYNAGWDIIRAERLERQKALGITPSSTELPPLNPGVKPWAELSARDQRLYARYMEVYAGVIQRLDWNVGRVLDTLERLGQAEDTLVILASDNGGSAEGTSTGVLNMLSGISNEIPPEVTDSCYDRMGERGTFPHYPTGWAMVSNTPFKLYKQMPELGGVADPLIVRWPRGEGPVGTIRREFIHISDVHPTILDVVGAETFPSLPSRKQVEGVSFRPRLAAKHPPARSQYFEIRGRRAFYQNGWRAVAAHQPGAQFAKDEWRLYNLAVDFNEQVDLAKQQPALVEELKTAWEEAAGRYQVLPLDDRSPLEKAWNGRWMSSQQSHWELRPEAVRLSSDVAPATPGRDHSIRVTLHRDDAGQEGVLVAYGSMYFGWVLYVHDNRLVYENAAVPFGLRTVADQDLPLGTCEIRYEQRMSARPFNGVGMLFINDEQVARFDLPRFAFGFAYQGIEVGRNGACPVSTRYVAPFRFTGLIQSVTIDYDVSPYSAEEIASLISGLRLRL